jgi:4-hydroxy-tetrahydrodipicolinate reductase
VEVLREARGISRDKVRHGREGLVGARPVDEIGVHALRGGDVVGELTVFLPDKASASKSPIAQRPRHLRPRSHPRRLLGSSAKSPLFEMKDVLGLGRIVRPQFRHKKTPSGKHLFPLCVFRGGEAHHEP